MDQQTEQKLLQAKDDLHAKLLAIPGVHATGIGFKRVGGARTNTIAICVHVRRKRPLRDVPEPERIPSTAQGFAVDVLEVSPPELCAKYRPLVGGCDLGVRSGGFWQGTLGCIVKDKNTQQVFALSAGHALRSVGSATFQPASFTVTDELGSTEKLIIDSQVDCGISNLTYYNDGGEPVIIGIGRVEGSRRLTTSDIGKRVMKRGATTALTTGIVSQLSVSGDGPNGPYSDQVYIEPYEGDFADTGDSGSVIVDGNNMIVGLLWAASTNSGQRGAMCNQIDHVLSKLGVVVLTQPDLAKPLAHKPKLEQLGALFSQNTRTRGHWQAFMQQRAELQRTLMRVPRIYALWTSLPQRELLNALLAGAADPDSLIPGQIAGRDVLDMLGQLRLAFAAHVRDRAARRAIDAFYADVASGIGSSWRAALSGQLEDKTLAAAE